jgi:CheY-like chemotaxis protein
MTGNEHQPLSAAPAVRVLVIEDNQDDITLLTRQLDKAGMIGQVKFLEDGQQALDYLHQDGGIQAALIMVIFLDLRLPGLGGLALLRNLKSSPHLQHIPVVVMTSSNDPEDMEECKRLQVANYVEKPVTFSSFSKSMADVFHSPNTKITQSVPKISRIVD